MQLEPIVIHLVPSFFPLPFKNYLEDKQLGSMILIDPITNETVGCSMINFALRRSQNIHLQNLTINKKLREKLNGHKGMVIWLTGISLTCISLTRGFKTVQFLA